MASVGCDNAADPTVRRSRVTSINRYAGAANLQVAGQPVEGRSGGGLFSAEGYVIGVCNGRDPKDQEGLFAAMEPICQQLDQVGLSFVYQSPQGWENAGSAGMLAAGRVPAMPAEMPGSVAARGADPAGVAAATAPMIAAPANLNAGERAMLEEIQRSRKEGSEVLVIIRPRDKLDARSEVFMLDKASPQFVEQVAAESRPKDGLQHTSLEVPRPRKKILEWSSTGAAPQLAP